MNVLVLNCGSSTVKFQLITTDLDAIAKNEDRRLARGGIERVGGEAIITLKTEGREQQRLAESLTDMRAAVDFFIRWATSERAGITGIHSIADIHAVGHRVRAVADSSFDPYKTNVPVADSVFTKKN